MAVTGLTSTITRLGGGRRLLCETAESSVNHDMVELSVSSLQGEQLLKSAGGLCSSTLPFRRVLVGKATPPLARFQSSSLLPSFLASVDADGFHLLLEDELLFCGVDDMVLYRKNEGIYIFISEYSR